MNSALPGISELLPVYNVETTLEECTESVLGQTYSNFELVSADDFSTDASLAVLSQYTDARIRIIRNTEKGLAPALNLGLEHCRAGLVVRKGADYLEVG